MKKNTYVYPAPGICSIYSIKIHFISHSVQAFDEKNIIDEEEKIHEEHLMVESGIQSNRGGGKTRNASKRNQMYQISEIEDDVGDEQEIEHDANQMTEQDQDDGILQSASVDPLQLVQICVPGESDNVSWVSLVQS